MAPAPPANTALPQITGTAADGQTLSATTGAWSGTPPMSYTYQWLSCDSTGANCQPVSGATAQSYQLGPGDDGTTLTVAVTATNAAGASTVSSPASAVVQSASPANVLAPAISGTPMDGQTLTASAGTWTGAGTIAYAYQWQSCDPSGNNCQAVAGATGSSYQLGPGDVGSTLTVVVTASNAAGTSSATSAASALIAPAPPSVAKAPSISGVPSDGQTLSASSGTWSGTAPVLVSYQWQSCDPSGSNCQAVAGATAPTYQLGPGDVGTTLVVVATATNAAGSASATSVPSPVIVEPPASAGAPVISGTAAVGQTVSVSNGSWSGTAPIAYSYQWQSCDSAGANCWNISGATDSTYTVPAWMAGAALQAVVTASNAGGSASSSAPSVGPVPGTGSIPATTYFPSSFWDQTIPADAPLDPQSATMARQLYNEALGLAPTMNYDCRRSTTLGWTNWNAAEMQYCHQVSGRAGIATSGDTPTLYTVGAGTPAVPVTIPTNVNLQAALSAVPIPPGAQQSPGSDAQMIIWQPSSDTMWELWQAYQDSSGQWHASGGGRIQHVSTDPGYYHNVPNTNSQCSTNPQVKYCEQTNWGGPSGRMPNLPGIMTLQQLASGEIDHALVIAVPSNVAGAWSWPAQNTDGTGNSIIPQGARIRIDPNLNLDAWFASLRDGHGNPRPIAPIERIIAKAMQTYGAIVDNSSPSVSFYTENYLPSGNDIFDGQYGLYGGQKPWQFTQDLPWEYTQVLQTHMCNNIQAGSPLYQTSCSPPKYVTAQPGSPCKPPTAVTPQPSQTSGPSIQITAPSWPNIGARVSFDALVTDPSGVTEVDFRVDGQLRYVSNFPHCALNQMQYTMGGVGGFWDAQTETHGQHVLEVDAYNSLGIESTATDTVNH